MTINNENISLPPHEFSNMWEVYDISNKCYFLRFLIDKASENAIWVLDGVFNNTTISTLEPYCLNKPKKKKLPFLRFHIFGSQEIQIPLKQEYRQAIDKQLDDLKFFENIMCQHIYEPNGYLMISYDYFADCWVSKNISRRALRKAKSQIDFRFCDPDKI